MKPVFDPLLGKLVGHEHEQAEAPKSLFKRYLATLVQNGDAPPIPFVLNQDDADYLGDISWGRVDMGIYTITNVLNTYPPHCIAVKSTTSLNGNDQCISIYKTSYGNIISFNPKIPDDGSIDINNSYSDPLFIEIIARQCGDPPVLVSAETNEAGDLIIMEFDKEMQIVGLLEAEYDIIYNNTRGDGIGFPVDPVPIVNPENRKQLIWNWDGIAPTDEITIEFTSRDVAYPNIFYVVSSDFGALDSFYCNVINNVVQ